MRHAIIAAIVIACGASQVSADDCLAQVSQYIKCGYRQNAQWPWPYVCPDRMAAREPFSIMVQNGWRRQNLLGAHHFTADGERLTTAGELKVRWILTQAPASFRDIFVERAINPQITAHRVVAARQYGQKVAIDGRTPVVEETYLMCEGRPASVVDQVNVRFQESMPPPVLPAAAAADAMAQ